MTLAGLIAKARRAYAMLRAQGSAIHRPADEGNLAAGKLRAYARRLMMLRWPLVFRPVAAIVATVIWPFASYRDASLLAQHSNPALAEANLKNTSWRAALKYNLPPTEFAAFGLWRDGAAHPDAWLYTLESSLLTAHLVAKPVADLVGDKVAFQTFCARHGNLATPETLAVFKAGQTVYQAEAQWNTSVVSKPVRSSMGRDVTIWQQRERAYLPVDAVDPLPLDQTGLITQLQHQSTLQRSGILLQPMLSMHPALAHLCATGPAVARIITGRWRDGSIEVLNAMLQRPNADAFKTHGGPFRLICVETGESLARLPGPHIFPTATDTPEFDDLSLPNWQTCCAELSKIHAAIDGQAPLLGWDVVFAPDGPTILEANTTLAPYFFQLASQAPAADGKWVALLAEYLP